MDAVWIDVPESFLEERHRRGADKKDEVWDGVLHMVPPPSSRHGSVTIALHGALLAIGRQRGLRAFGEATGLYDATPDASNYRVPDGMLVRPDQVSHRGAEGAELVVEVLSPRDESRAKLAFYAQRGVPEVWLIEPETCRVEVLVRGDRGYLAVGGPSGPVRSPTLGVELETRPGGVLVLADGDARYEI